MVRSRRDAPEQLARRLERTRQANLVALNELLALGMPSLDTSTGRLLRGVLLDVEAFQTNLAAAVNAYLRSATSSVTSPG